MRSIEFVANIHNAHLVPPPQYTRFMKQQEGKQVRATISWNLKKRSQPQNRFYFGPVIQCVREWLNEQGYNFDATETHEFIVRHIWKYTEVTMIDGVPYEKRLSSTKLSTKDWEDNIEKVRQYGAEHGFFVPFPNEGESQ